MATFWERAARLAYMYHVFFFVFCLFVILIIVLFGFEGGTLVLIEPVRSFLSLQTGRCLLFLDSTVQVLTINA